MSVEIATVATPELEEAFALLIPQLSTSSKPMEIEDLARLIAQDGIYLLLFRSDVDKKILGMLTLVTFEIPTGKRAWIEDVVVDGEARGQGAGQQLVEAAIDLAHQKGMKSIDLTSRPSREAANRLYVRTGFQLRETNIYRHAN